MRRLMTIATLVTFGAIPAFADDIVQVPSRHDVPTTADRLAQNIEKGGATLFARVNHGEGASAVGMDIGASELLIFGNPKAGTPVMVENRLAGLDLPLKVLVYEDAEGKTWLAYHEVDEMLDDHDIDNKDIIAPLQTALEKLTDSAAN